MDQKLTEDFRQQTLAHSSWQREQHRQRHVDVTDSVWFGDDKESDVTRVEAMYLGKEKQGKRERGAESEGREPAVRRGVRGIQQVSGRLSAVVRRSRVGVMTRGNACVRAHKERGAVQHPIWSTLMTTPRGQPPMLGRKGWKEMCENLNSGYSVSSVLFLDFIHLFISLKKRTGLWVGKGGGIWRGEAGMARVGKGYCPLWDVGLRLAG